MGNATSLAPNPHRGDWIDFLTWIADESTQAEAARTVIAIVEKPWHFADEYARYIAAGGVDR